MGQGWVNMGVVGDGAGEEGSACTALQATARNLNCRPSQREDWLSGVQRTDGSEQEYRGWCEGNGSEARVTAHVGYDGSLNRMGGGERKGAAVEMGTKIVKSSLQHQGGLDNLPATQKLCE